MFLSTLRGTAVVAATAAGLLLTASPAHAVVYAHGEFLYTNRAYLCFEAYAGTSVGSGQCGVSFSVDEFIFAVWFEDNSCSGVANATLTISSPSSGSISTHGLYVVNRGTGTFDGVGSSGAATATSHAVIHGGPCRSFEDPVSIGVGVEGHYDLSA